MYRMAVLEWKLVVQPVTCLSYSGFNFSFYTDNILHVAEMQYKVDTLTGMLLHTMADTSGIRPMIVTLVGKLITISVQRTYNNPVHITTSSLLT